MDFAQHLQSAIAKAPLDALGIDLRAVEHKLRFPMADILAKVPGDSLAARARAIGVSRQTMYVWAQERFRPSGPQAKIIADLTGVPVEQICDYQEGKGDGSFGEPTRKKAGRLAKAGKALPLRAKRVRRTVRRVAPEQGKRGNDRPTRGRNPRRPVSGAGD